MSAIIQAPPDKLRRLRELQERKRQLEAERDRSVASRAKAYYHDPVGFARSCMDWPADRFLTGYQQDILESLGKPPPGDILRSRVAVRGPHGLGKTCLAATAVLWFALTREAAGVDWKVATTAGSWHQLTQYLWPEIHRWSGRVRWDVVREGRAFGRNELQNLNLKLAHGHVFAGASANAALIEGAHADSLLFVYDEAKAIPAATFDACEGAFSGTGEALALAISTPGDPSGRFFDIHKRRPGYEDWQARHVTLDEAIAAGRISAEWAEQRLRQWGGDSAVYANRVLGNFHAGDEDTVVPLRWVEAANERWAEWDAAGRPEPPGPHRDGVDVARSGTDKTVIAIRRGPVVTELRRSSREDTMQTTGRVKGHLDSDPAATALVDVIGIGAGVLDRLREQGCKAEPFNASAGTSNKDATGELGFANVRSAAWWCLREALDPSRDSEVALPPDDMLLGDLTAPKWKVLSGGKIQVESKDEIRKRLGRSTDDGDAVVQAFWEEYSSADAWIEWARKKALAAAEAASDGEPEADTVTTPAPDQQPEPSTSLPPPRSFTAEQASKGRLALATGRLTRDGDGWTVTSSDGRGAYQVADGKCSCPAGQHGRACYHLMAALLADEHGLPVVADPVAARQAARNAAFRSQQGWR